MTTEQKATTTLVEGGSQIHVTQTDGWLNLQQGKDVVVLSPLQTNQLREWLRAVRHP